MRKKLLSKFPYGRVQLDLDKCGLIPARNSSSGRAPLDAHSSSPRPLKSPK